MPFTVIEWSGCQELPLPAGPFLVASRRTTVRRTTTAFDGCCQQIAETHNGAASILGFLMPSRERTYKDHELSDFLEGRERFTTMPRRSCSWRIKQKTSVLMYGHPRLTASDVRGSPVNIRSFSVGGRGPSFTMLRAGQSVARELPKLRWLKGVGQPARWVASDYTLKRRSWDLSLIWAMRRRIYYDSSGRRVRWESEIVRVINPEPATEEKLAQCDDIKVWLRLKTQSVQASRYPASLDWIPPTSNTCERLFSKACCVLIDYRKSMSNETFGAIMFLHGNRAWWEASCHSSCTEW
ncbi:hypothetical protein K470DRAFT_100608 [Piedraia hortae CBS 480.64]|uniref:HAT C-terminal dimerisation domain-containing protein n=1 Tax=Piedraia hortae CBS 480.64 TaxID=1314780 RepID=A0A6A7BVS8_9PEZI|nr:hypothetical protein K470DRAFT_100608 [Piedraia hortae CBS 480.64]